MKKRERRHNIRVIILFSICLFLMGFCSVSASELTEKINKIDENTYNILSPDGSVHMKLYVDTDKQVKYSVKKAKGEKKYNTVLQGDVDEDEKLAENDIVCMRKIIMDETIDKKTIAICDLNNDGKITVSDVIKLRKAVLEGTVFEKKEYEVETVFTDGEVWIDNSLMGVVLDDKNYFNGVSIVNVNTKEIHRKYSHNGNASEITEDGVEAVFTMLYQGYTYYIDVRVYDNGVAFRYRFPQQSGETRKVNNEFTSFALRKDIDKVWYGVNNQDYEAVIEAHNPRNASGEHIVAPLTAELSNKKGYIAVQEAGLNTTYAGTNFVAKGNCQYQISNTWDTAYENVAYSTKGNITTAWRLVNIAETLDELVNNYNVYHVNEEPDEQLFADTSWIVPGRSAWSWLTDYGASLATAKGMYEYTENAARLGFEYNVIDENYSKWNNYREELKKLGEYGESLNVKQVLWAQISTNGNGFKMTNVEEARNYLDLLKESHLYGGKIDFWWSEASTDRENKNNTALQEAILQMAAQRKLFINFHGCNKPAGLDATYPNELNREAIRGLENVGSSQNTEYKKQAAWLSRQLFTRYLSGHGDWTPACNTMMQIASLICIDAPFNVIATNPKDILDNEAVEFIKSVPTVWNQTCVLSNSEIGKLAIYAKESNKTWFVGGISAADNKDVKIDLRSFLGDGTYCMELWTEDENGNKVKTKRNVTANEEVVIGDLKEAGGFAARFSKLEINYYGGEIFYNHPIEVKTASADSIVKYTTDGTDPMTSKSAVRYTKPISLGQSCHLSIAITSGDGKGTKICHIFNKIGEQSVTKKVQYNKDKTEAKVALMSNYPCTIYYTVDGSEPTIKSNRYIEAINIRKYTTIKVLSVSEENGNTKNMEFTVFVNGKEIEPDIYLSGDYMNGSTDWGSIKIDKNLEGDTISLGGTNSSNGTKYVHGIGLNAKGSLTYNIPEGAEQFVGVVGIDDRVWDSGSGHQASSTLTILFDNQEYYKTAVFRRGDKYNIAVDIPGDAKKMKLYFGDAEDGITCDNISMGNAGWKMNTSPNQFLGKDYISATTGWNEDQPNVNQNTKGKTIAIAGNQYAHGISTNANGAFIYRIPNNAMKLVGTVGVDDCVYDNKNDGMKASIICEIFFDDNNTSSYSSDILRPGEKANVNVIVPTGAEKVRIVFTDAGDGITCDNASFGNAGWVLSKTPDIYLGKDYISATTGWSEDPASVNTNTKGGTISIGGEKYLKGISTNANGTFVYNIPSGVKTFIGIAGVDDCVYDNEKDGEKASITCKIYFDDNNTPIYTTKILKRGEYDYIHVNVPENSKKIKIVFTDAGDGIICDNASMGNTGWVIE